MGIHRYEDYKIIEMFLRVFLNFKITYKFKEKLIVTKTKPKKYNKSLKYNIYHRFNNRPVIDRFGIF